MSEKKYVLQFGSLAGWPYSLAEALSAKGCFSRNVIPIDSDVHDLDRRLPHHRSLCSKSDSKVARVAKRVAFLNEAARDCSLVHYHGDLILPRNYHHFLEGRLFNARGIPMIMSFGGGDARIVSEARARNPYFYRPLDERRDEDTRRFLRSLSRYVRYIATDFEMMTYTERYFEKTFVLRQPIDISAFPYIEPDLDRPPVLLHVPTYVDVKGTEYIVAAVERLRSEGFVFEFRLKRQLTQAQFYAEMASCDVYIDELRCGSHGMTAVESMAAGKPTITYMREDLLSRYPAELPLVNANPDTIYSKLRELVSEPSMRREISINSRKYAEKYHAADVVADDMMKAYAEMGM